MKKKFMALMLGVTMVISVAACGGPDANNSNNKPASGQADEPTQEPTSEPEPADEEGEDGENELIYNEANSLKIGMPASLTAADSGVEGLAAFTNEEKTTFITVTGPFEDDTAAPELLTEEMFTSMFQEGGYADITIDNVGTVTQPDGATAVAAFATGSMEGGEKSNLVMQYYFSEDGSGYYIINYMYPLDDTATDDSIADILASVTAK